MLLQDIWTVFWRDWVVLQRRLKKFIFSRMVAPLLYMVAFGWGLGRSIQVTDGSYLDFLVPGILALNSMNISFNSVTPVHSERIYHKSLEEYIIAPVIPEAFVIGKVLAAVLRGLISSAIILVLAALFGAQLHLSLLFVLVLIVNCIIFSEIGFFAAMTINTYEEMGQVNTYILLPMSFLCGTFFSVHALPELVRYAIQALPLTHTSYLLRGMSLEQPVSLLSLGVLVIYAVAFFLMARWAYLRQKK